MNWQAALLICLTKKLICLTKSQKNTGFVGLPQVFHLNLKSKHSSSYNVKHLEIMLEQA